MQELLAGTSLKLKALKYVSYLKLFKIYSILEYAIVIQSTALRYYMTKVIVNINVKAFHIFTASLNHHRS